MEPIIFSTFVSRLPSDLLSIIFDHFEGWEAARAACVCSSWNEWLCEDESGWRDRFWRTFSQAALPDVPFLARWADYRLLLPHSQQTVSDAGGHAVLQPSGLTLYAPPPQNLTPAEITTLVVRAHFCTTTEEVRERGWRCVKSCTACIAGSDPHFRSWYEGAVSAFRGVHSQLRTPWLVRYKGESVDELTAGLLHVGQRWRIIRLPDDAKTSWRRLYAAVAARALRSLCRVCLHHTGSRHAVLRVPMCSGPCACRFPVLRFKEAAGLLTDEGEHALRLLSCTAHRRTYCAEKPRMRILALKSTFDALCALGHGHHV